MKRFLALALALAVGSAVFTGCSNSGKKESTQIAAGAETPATSSEVSGETDYPKKTIQLIAPYKPGGDTDFNARALAQYMEAELGQPVVVVNVDGSGGVTGSRKVKDAEPDGYTALLMHPALMVSQIAGTSDYGIDAFEYVATSGEHPGEIICVNAESGFETFEDLVNYSKEHPGEINVAADMGTMSHIIAMMIEDAGANINIVSAGGASERVAQLLGGHIDAIINSYGTIKDYLETGEFVALGTTKETESKAFPEIRPLVEQGYAVSFPKEYFVLMPKGTPSEITEKFAQAIKSVTENPEYQKMIWDSYGQEPFFATKEEAQPQIEKVEKILVNYKERFASK